MGEQVPVKNRKKVIGYYKKFESRIGYKLVMHDAKHFGYYPNGMERLTERQALENQQSLIGESLDLRNGQVVLDAGCGRGVTACYLAEKFHSTIYGVDIVEFELNIARKKAVTNGLSELVHFQNMDYSQLEYPDGNFDGVYTSETLSHAVSVECVLREFFRVLKPGGKITLLEYTLAEDEEFSAKEKKSLDFIVEGSAMAGLKSFRHETFSSLLESVGFVNTTERNLTQNMSPSFLRLYAKSKWIYRFIKFLGLKKHFVNIATPSELLPLINRDLIRYCIFSAVKPDPC